MRSLYLVGLLYLSFSTYVLARQETLQLVPIDGSAPVDVPPAGSAGEWFQRVKPSCNALEVETILRRDPPLKGVAGTGFGAACLALGGRIEAARALIMTLPGGERHVAAGIVFDVAHPIADMGDDKSAGPIMGLVVEFWPNHYMALYHAGAARYATGDFATAERHLTEFLRHYHQNDGWTANARTMLARIAGR